MKIKRLDLEAYGHFTNFTIDFQSDSPGLHIIYGPNEAGKSTALSALRELLYGIEARTPYNFLHDYKKLRIGGHLENADGRELTFWRLKKNNGDLLDADQKIIDQSVLAEFLHGIEAPLFSSLFGIDHETLITGGDDILKQRGDVGQALFSAGAGLSSLHGIIETLDKECESLFKSGGSKPELNQAIKEYKDIKNEIRTLTLSSSAWKEQQDIVESASRDLEKVETDKQSVGSELERLKRLQRAIPNLVKRGTLQVILKELGDLGYLSLDFSDRLQAVLTDRKNVGQTLIDARSRKEVLDQKRSAASPRQEFLDQSESIDALHQRLGVQRQAQQDRPAIHDELLQCRTKAETFLSQATPSLDISETEKIKNLLAKRQQILTHGNQFAGLDNGLIQAKENLTTLSTDLQTVKDQLDALPAVGDLRGLTAAVTSAQKVGDIDSVLRNNERDTRLLLSNAEDDLKTIGLWTGSLEGFSTLPLVSSETIETFVESFRDSTDERRKNQQDQKAVQEELDRVRRDLKVIEKTGTVATEDDLVQARERRDQGWQLVKRVWLCGEEIPDEISAFDCTQDLPDAFEDGLRTADELSDHLRSAADRVHQYASLLAEAEKLEEQQQRYKEESTTLGEQKTQLELEWQSLWEQCSLTARTPLEMRTWLNQGQAIISTFREAKQKQSDRRPLLEQQRILFADLMSALANLGRNQVFTSEELSPILIYSEQVLAELKEIHGQNQALQNENARIEKALSPARNSLEESRNAMLGWREQWSTALAGFGLPDDAQPDQAAEVLETLRTCREKIVEADVLEKRIKDIDQSTQDFAAEVGSLVRSLASELDALTPEQAVVQLQATVQEAEKTKSILEKLDEDMASTEDEIRLGLIEQGRVDTEMTSLQELACCEKEDELIEMEARFREYLETKKDLTNLEEALLGLAEGISLDELETQRQSIDPNELPGQIEIITRQIQNELDPQIKSLSEQKGEARNELLKMDGSGQAAAMEDAAQEALAKVRRLADRYLRVRLGNQLLKKEIERYRQENQDPILKSASRYFSELTLDIYSGLRSDLDDSGGPILVGVSHDGSTKTVEKMSSGTRDQLYLALRLATLEWRLEKHEPIPFIADDILVNFDDQRSAATLNALAELGKKNQVILFTHHQQIVRTVQSLNMGDHVFVHPLSPAPAPLQ
jgi:uncharacterized protein YhaN